MHKNPFSILCYSTHLILSKVVKKGLRSYCNAKFLIFPLSPLLWIHAFQWQNKYINKYKTEVERDKHHEKYKEQSSSFNWWYFGYIDFRMAKVCLAVQSNLIQVVSENSEKFVRFHVSNISSYIRTHHEHKTFLLSLSKQSKIKGFYFTTQKHVYEILYAIVRRFSQLLHY